MRFSRTRRRKRFLNFYDRDQWLTNLNLSTRRFFLRSRLKQCGTQTQAQTVPGVRARFRLSHWCIQIASWPVSQFPCRRPHRERIVGPERRSLVRNGYTLKRLPFAVPARVGSAGTTNRWPDWRRLPGQAKGAGPSEQCYLGPARTFGHSFLMKRFASRSMSPWKVPNLFSIPQAAKSAVATNIGPS